MILFVVMICRLRSHMISSLLKSILNGCRMMTLLVPRSFVQRFIYFQTYLDGWRWGCYLWLFLVGMLIMDSVSDVFPWFYRKILGGSSRTCMSVTNNMISSRRVIICHDRKFLFKELLIKKSFSKCRDRDRVDLDEIARPLQNGFYSKTNTDLINIRIRIFPLFFCTALSHA